MNDLNMLFDSRLAADAGSEQLRQKLIQHINTIDNHQQQFAQMIAKKRGTQRPYLNHLR